MAKKRKSKAQIKRLMKRAEARGEVYDYNGTTEEEESLKKGVQGETGGSSVLPAPPSSFPAKEAQAEENNEGKNRNTNNRDRSTDQNTDKVKLLAASMKLKRTLEEIAQDSKLKSKERRSAKRKAEAIALEESGCTAEELMKWYEEENLISKSTDHGGQQGTWKKSDRDRDRDRNQNPYIVFVGQLSYDTDKKTLFEHIQNELVGKEGDGNSPLEVTEETVQVRLLTDVKTRKSRGMAFVQVSTPELLYGCLRLHHTVLDGRRINVERTAGGNRTSEGRRSKLARYRQEQDELLSRAVDEMLEDRYERTGDIQRGELDDGAVALCKRHSAAAVRAALDRYVDSNGRDMDNPSAYFTFLLGKLAHEGVFDDQKQQAKDKQQQQQQQRGRTRESKKYAATERPRKRVKSSAGDIDGSTNHRLMEDSELIKRGVDMSISQNSIRRGNDKSGNDDKSLSKIFPSLSSRGRGRASTK